LVDDKIGLENSCAQDIFSVSMDEKNPEIFFFFRKSEIIYESESLIKQYQEINIRLNHDNYLPKPDSTLPQMEASVLSSFTLCD
jgi:hypothetical protein